MSDSENNSIMTNIIVKILKIRIPTLLFINKDETSLLPLKKKKKKKPCFFFNFKKNKLIKSPFIIF